MITSAERKGSPGEEEIHLLGVTKKKKKRRRRKKKKKCDHLKERIVCYLLLLQLQDVTEVVKRCVPQGEVVLFPSSCHVLHLLLLHHRDHRALRFGLA